MRNWQAEGIPPLELNIGCGVGAPAPPPPRNARRRAAGLSAVATAASAKTTVAATSTRLALGSSLPGPAGGWSLAVLSAAATTSPLGLEDAFTPYLPGPPISTRSQAGPAGPMDIGKPAGGIAQTG